MLNQTVYRHLANISIQAEEVLDMHLLEVVIHCSDTFIVVVRF